MKQMMRVAAWAGSVLVAGAGIAAQEGAPDYPKLTGGGDFRLRQETFDHIPIKVDPPGETRGGLNNYIRFRTRVWGQFDLNEHVGVYGRLANEFRHYYDPENTSWDFPDETVVDNLYLDLRKLMADESVSIRIGRQDLFYAPGRPFGNGRLILEGTPKDGSRTIYFDAARFTWAKDKATVNLIGIYDKSDAQLLINDQGRDVTGYSSAYNDLDESGVILYGTYALAKDVWLESYYIYKHESDWQNGAATIPQLDVHTVGGLVAVKINDLLSANLEAAGQVGDRDGQDVMGYMVDGGVKAAFLRDTAAKPWSKLGVTWYSGDDPSSKDDEGWNPLWGRYPQNGTADLLAYTFDADGAARWSNLTFAYAHAGLSLSKDTIVSAMLGQVMAPEADGPGGGHQRGLYAGATIGSTLAHPGISAKDVVKGHIVVEMLEPGDYYKSDRDTAYFMRWEIGYSF